MRLERPEIKNTQPNKSRYIIVKREKKYMFTIISTNEIWDRLNNLIVFYEPKLCRNQKRGCTDLYLYLSFL